ncbi:aldo/keto reductase [Streptomyces turgidiscabies]|uniref:Oxidoreductase, aldo/keto reductase family protein n=1 Tax=Streptomyces turgidiscabies (strain Car8) TaxID=698760 RepID=L7F8N6_STRT8|nr:MULTISPECIES: aldo/keto reductase [Streptomyces]ELP67035.1 oxidoreductase, aldo/keto reductase family protein [Streptomyces turgidiscabies Car8]MDX3494414.1 aldo/keto reductase [Streptomyces turgidiscabies]GAQ74693.1 general stress protein 69 [Streptomyces turgidiscabies]
METTHSTGSTDSTGTTQAFANRTLGRSGIEVSPLGFGCWAIGGEWGAPDGQPLGWGKVDDDESVRAVRRALDLGVTFFDTADVYGTGHSERVLGRALGKHRSDVVIATKWGNLFDERTRIADGQDDSPGYVRRALTASLERLGADHVDLYQLHLSEGDLDAAAQLRDVCEELVTEGLIRAYAWSTDDPARAALFAEGPHCAAVQHCLNVVQDAPEMLALCEESGIASINRSPLAMGLLTGKRAAGQALEAGDIRSAPPAWLPGFTAGAGADPDWLAHVDALRSVLTSGGRTLAQGALGWLWARSPRTVPIPGFRSVAQAEENAGAMAKGPLTAAQLAEIDQLLGR